jgi:branched-chain amino acid aminotransferase
MIAYVNGHLVPAAEATVSIFDRGLLFGDAVFDTLRTFNGLPFRLDAHLERLGRSLRYVELNDGAIVQEVRAATAKVVARNLGEIRAVGDVWINQLVTRGPMANVGIDAEPRPTVIVMLKRFDFGAFAPFYDRGVDLHVSLTTQHFAGAVDPRVKAANRLAAVRAELKGRRMSHLGGGHWTLIFNADGSVAETHGANVCLVFEGALVRPPRHEVLGGISLQTLCELAPGVGLRVEERKITLYDLLNADEVLITGSSFCVLPVASVDGIALGPQRQIYLRLLEAWIDLAGLDFVSQARERAGLVERIQPDEAARKYSSRR